MAERELCISCLVVSCNLPMVRPSRQPMSGDCCSNKLEGCFCFVPSLTIDFKLHVVSLATDTFLSALAPFAFPALY